METTNKTKMKKQVQMAAELHFELKQMQNDANFLRVQRSALSVPAVIELLLRYIKAKEVDAALWMASQTPTITKPRGRVVE